MYREVRPHDSPLFQKSYVRIADELTRSGVALNADVPLDVAVWQALEARNSNRAVGSHCNFNRFLGTLSSSMKNTPMWETDAFERTFMAIEFDVLKGGKLMEKMQVKEYKQIHHAGARFPTLLNISIPLAILTYTLVNLSITLARLTPR